MVRFAAERVVGVGMLGAVLFDDLDRIAPFVEEEVAVEATFIDLHRFATEVVVGEGVDLAGRGRGRRCAQQRRRAGTRMDIAFEAVPCHATSGVQVVAGHVTQLMPCPRAHCAP